MHVLSQIDAADKKDTLSLDVEKNPYCMRDFCTVPTICRVRKPVAASHGVSKDLQKCGMLRGGGGRGGKKSQPTLLEGLSQLLKANSVPDNDEKQLFLELQELVSNKPHNLLQALKSLVTKHTKGPRKVVLQQHDRSVNFTLPEQQSDWQTVQRKKVRAATSGSDSWHYRRDDWRPPAGMAIGFAHDANHLGTLLDESSGVAWIMSTDNPEEAEEAVRMVRGANYDEECHGLTLIFDGRSHEIGDWGEDAELIRVPGTCRGRLQFKRVWIVRIGSRTAALATRSVTPLKVTKPPATLAEQRAWISITALMIGRCPPRDRLNIFELGLHRKVLRAMPFWILGTFGMKTILELLDLHGLIRWLRRAHCFMRLAPMAVVLGTSLILLVIRTRSLLQIRLHGSHGKIPRLTSAIFNG